MAVTVTEAWQSGDLSDEYGYKLYIVAGTAVEDTALAALQAGAVSSIGNLVHDQKRDRVERLTDDTWLGTAVYREAEKVDEAGDTTFSFSTLGGTEKITHSISTIQKYPAAGKTAIDFKQGINVARVGGVLQTQGVEIEVKSFEFSIRVVHDAGDIDGTYIGVLYALSKRVNNGSLTVFGKTFNAGELLFRGAEGDVKDDGSGELTYHFSAKPNETGVTIGTVTGIAAKGHEYIWVFTEETEDATAHRKTSIPLQANVEQVYRTGDLSGLKI